MLESKFCRELYELSGVPPSEALQLIYYWDGKGGWEEQPVQLRPKNSTPLFRAVVEYKHCAYGISYSAKGAWWMPGHSEVPNTFIPWDEINLLKYKSKSFGNAEIETDYFYLLAPEDFLDEIYTYLVLFSYHASLFSGKANLFINKIIDSRSKMRGNQSRFLINVRE